MQAAWHLGTVAIGGFIKIGGAYMVNMTSGNMVEGTALIIAGLLIQFLHFIDIR